MSGFFKSIVNQFSNLTDIEKDANLICWGDSLTLGAGQNPYPSQISTLTGFEAINKGVGGETSTQIKTRFLADVGNHRCFSIIWVGRNNYSNPTAVLADIASIVAALGHENYRVLTVLNGEFGSGEYLGGSGYIQIESINSGIKSVYGTKSIDVRAALINAYDSGSAQDVIDYGRKIVPASLRVDQIHLNSAGYAIVASTVAASMGEPAEGIAKILTTKLIRFILGSPPVDIGTVTPVKMRATQLRVSDVNITPSGNNLSLHTSGRWLPLTDGTIDHGATGFRWKDSYISNNMWIGVKRIYPNGVGDLQIGSRWLPDTNSTYDLGAGSLQWKDGYFSGRVYIAGNPVLNARQPIISNPNDPATTQAAVISILAAMRTHGLITT